MTEIITVADLRPYHCVTGIRRWFELHGLDFADFLKNGIDAEALLATGDALAINAVERIRRG